MRIKAIDCLLLMCSIPIALGVQAKAQNFSLLYSFGTNTGDPINPYSPCVIAQGRDGNLYSTTTYGGTLGDGAAFKITPTGTLTTLYEFDLTHGEYPSSGLTLGRDGNLYGTTVFGGSTNNGVIFKLTPAGQITVLYQFTGGSDGGYPYAPPFQASDGNFYGSTSKGALGWGTIYKLTRTGSLSTLHQFNYSVDGSFPQGPLIQARNGKLYGTTREGGPGGFGTVFSITTSGKLATLYAFDNVHGMQPEGGLVEASNGNFYGTTAWGGIKTYGVIYTISPSGALTVLHNLTQSDGKNPYANLLLATDGNLYGATSAGGSLGYGTLFRITTSGTFAVLLNFDGTHGGSPYVTPMQLTSGMLYGDTEIGGAYNSGAFYSLDMGLNPFISLLSNAGKAGQSVEILGQGFTGASSVLFGTGSASFSVVSDTYMTAVVPVTGTTGTVVVSTPAGTLTSARSFSVLPTIANFNPTAGSPGSNVAINGTGLMQTTRVKIGGVTAAFTVNSGTQVTATVPAGAKTGKVAVTTTGGTASKGTFTVTSSPVITGLLVNGTPSNTGNIGDTLTIQGFGFGASIGFSTASLAGVPLAGPGVRPISWSDTSIVAKIPQEADSGLVIVTVVNGTGHYDSNPMNFAVAVVITGVSPASGPVGTLVSVAGNGFGTTGGTVTFNGTPATWSGWTDTLISVPVPAGATAGPIVLTVNGQVSNGFPFTPIP